MRKEVKKMSDLISRSELINKIRGIVPSSQDVDFIVRLIDAQPTAYDKDKVVEELEKWSSEVQVVSEVNGKIHRVKVVNAERAINIAREGGVE